MTARQAPQEGIRALEIWRCTECGHRISRDLVTPEAPPHCLGAEACLGFYAKSAIWEPLPPWPGGIKARDLRMVESAGCISDADARYWARQRAADRKERL